MQMYLEEESNEFGHLIVALQIVSTLEVVVEWLVVWFHRPVHLAHLQNL